MKELYVAKIAAAVVVLYVRVKRTSLNPRGEDKKKRDLNQTFQTFLFCSFANGRHNSKGEFVATRKSGFMTGMNANAVW